MVSENRLRELIRDVLEEEGGHGFRHGHGAADEIPGILEPGPRVGAGDPDTVQVGDLWVGTQAGMSLISAPGLVLVDTNASMIAARKITAGSNITITDNGGGSTLVISASAAGGGVFYVPFGSEASIGEAYTP